jgi:hypothetical protein
MLRPASTLPCTTAQQQAKAKVSIVDCGILISIVGLKGCHPATVGVSPRMNQINYLQALKG